MCAAMGAAGWGRSTRCRFAVMGTSSIGGSEATAAVCPQSGWTDGRADGSGVGDGWKSQRKQQCATFLKTFFTLIADMRRWTGTTTGYTTSSGNKHGN